MVNSVKYLQEIHENPAGKFLFTKRYRYYLFNAYCLKTYRHTLKILRHVLQEF